VILTTSVRRSGQTQRRDDGRTSSLQSPASVEPTTELERLLLFAVIALLPLQEHVPSIAGFSVMYIMFALLAGYVLLWRAKLLGKIISHPVILAGGALVSIGLVMEMANGSSGYFEIWRIGFMFLGAICVATLCRDRQAMQFGFYGYLVAALSLSALLFLTMHGSLSSSIATDFKEANMMRKNALSGVALQADPNDMALFIAQGAIVALVMGIMERSRRRRLVFVGISVICLVATFLPMSRGGVVIVLLSCGAVLYAHGVMQPKVLIAIGMFALGILLFVPEGVYSRFKFVEVDRQGNLHGRAQLLSNAITHLPEYIWTGVGRGNFYEKWGPQHGFWTSSHNCYVQVTLYWGLPGLLALLALVWQAYRCIPRHCGRDLLGLCLLGIAVSVLLESLVIHNMYDKYYSLALGMIVASSRWIWPKGIVHQYREG